LKGEIIVAKKQKPLTYCLRSKTPDTDLTGVFYYCLRSKTPDTDLTGGFYVIQDHIKYYLEKGYVINLFVDKPEMIKWFDKHKNLNIYVKEDI